MLAETGVMDQTDIPPEALLQEARALIQAAHHSTDEERLAVLLRWAQEILESLVQAQVPAASWLYATLLKLKAQIAGVGLDDEAFGEEYWRLVRAAAAGGHAEAQFALACELDGPETAAESARLFQAAADQGHPYALWVHGLNLLGGKGVPPDKEQALRVILQAAQKNFEGAIRFLADAYAHGDYGFEKDEELAAAWRQRLSDQALIRY